MKVEFSFAPMGLGRMWLYPGLTPWAAIFRRFAAFVLGGLLVRDLYYCIEGWFGLALAVEK
jgi:hypothetical protein